ncbi:MAG: PhzF family phenazine biosynthesis protein [Bacteroidales bacterium]|nr:PhzF family phenazine biosynthesis protein [Bacteroidales bacterium]
MKYYIVDAFTDQPFGGNPAGVVLLGNLAFPDDKLMLQIAAELRYSETAFVRQDAEKEFSIRYFTPVDEVELCGHATIASFGTLFQEGVLKEGERCLYHTKAGGLNAVVGQKVMMQMAEPQLIQILDDSQLLDEIYQAVGCSHESLGLLPQIVSTGLPDIMLPIGDVATLHALRPDMEAVARITRRLQTVSFHAFAFGNDGYTAHVRDFAPLYGVNEESATGTANAALSYYLFVNKLISNPSQCAFLQGEAMRRPSVIATTLEMKNGVCDIWVGGESRIVAKGELL